MVKAKQVDLEDLAHPLKDFQLPKRTGWEKSLADLFEKYLIYYEELPNNKKVISSMIKFEDMYRPIQRGSKYADLFGHLAAINEEREAKRAQIYMAKKDLIITKGEGGGKTLVLTTRAHRIFYKQYPLATLRKKGWDGTWTIVMYDIPEKEYVQRNYLRRRLENLGFGTVQKSVMVSPLPLEEAIQELGEGEKLEKYIWVLRARNVLGLSNSEVVQKAYPIVQEIYSLYEVLDEAISVIHQNKDGDLKEEWKILFLAVNAKDPYLPGELLPKDWAGERCEKEFRRLTLPFLKRLLSL